MTKLFCSICTLWYLLIANTTFAYSHADTLRGSNGRGRIWWDVVRYDLKADLDIEQKTIVGTNTISYKVVGEPCDSMQIDLQEPLRIAKVAISVMPVGPEGTIGAKPEVITDLVREGNVWWVKYRFSEFKKDVVYQLTVNYEGVPKAAVNPPWDGGISWETDKSGKPWVAVSCQGLGASVWWPCKDAQWDEPDAGMSLHIAVPKHPELKVVCNGRQNSDTWNVTNPINNYDATFYIGDYVHWGDTTMGEKGILDLNYWVLCTNLEVAKKHFEQVKPMIHCFEHWAGPYPFYEDGYKLVESPYLGMEHQGAIAYGNHFRMGYNGSDPTNTGLGLTFDYIIVHESGHEWFGNNITAKDMADNWIHEGITDYLESLYIDCTGGKEKAATYCKGEWSRIYNNAPLIPDYGVNNEPTGDMYNKGAAVMYMIRQMTNDDERFRTMLRGLNSTFYHGTVTTAQVEDYIAKETGLDLQAFFNQYLRTKKIPKLQYSLSGNVLKYRFTNVVDGFTLPLSVSANGVTTLVKPTGEWQKMKWVNGKELTWDTNYLITTK